jgi:hypothetical protein
MLLISERNYADFETDVMTSSDIPHSASNRRWKENILIDYVRVKEMDDRAVISFFYDTEKPGFLASMKFGCVLVLMEHGA